ncbi:MAG: hypothetical protein HC862_22465 [Scytonema sp. RU_4_4]|nr:hypothetical protein [Scytonema sp. RU_4_4]NJR76040.1 hypothetical protein [Scytonema sp. CRU_2_7]
MLQTYKAILRGNCIEWRESAPLSPNPEQPMTVLVTILDEPIGGESSATGQKMASILEQLADIHAFAEITDPIVWDIHNEF